VLSCGLGIDGIGGLGYCGGPGETDESSHGIKAGNYKAKDEVALFLIFGKIERSIGKS